MLQAVDRDLSCRIHVCSIILITFAQAYFCTVMEILRITMFSFLDEMKMLLAIKVLQ